MTTSKTFRRRVSALLIATAAATAPFAAPVANAQGYSDALGPELTQVDSVDSGRYAGTWYQVAAVPQVFNLQCIDRTTAEYAVIDDSTLSVRNSCGDVFGGTSVVEGSARITDAATNASLRVAIDGIPGQNPDGPTNYRVTYLADDYSLAIVGDPARRSGFVLSRTPALADDEWALVADVIEDRGYQPCTFVTSPQPDGRRDATPVCAL